MSIYGNNSPNPRFFSQVAREPPEEAETFRTLDDESVPPLPPVELERGPAGAVRVPETGRYWDALHRHAMDGLDAAAKAPAAASTNTAPGYTGIYRSANFPVLVPHGATPVVTNLGKENRVKRGGLYGDNDGFSLTSRLVPQQSGAHVPYSACQGHLGVLPCAQSAAMTKPEPYRHHRHLGGWRVGRNTPEQIAAKSRQVGLCTR